MARVVKSANGVSRGGRPTEQVAAPNKKTNARGIKK